MQQILHNLLDNIVEIIWLKGDNFNIEERGVHRVALFKIFKGNAAKLPTAKTEGYMYITQDQGDIYVDISSTERKQLNANYANKLRDSTDTSKLLNKGDLGQAVYFSGGVPALCREHVDLETDQTIGGVKTFSSPITLGSTATPGGINLYANGYKVNIVGGALTTNRTLTLPNATGTIALTSHTHTTSVSWANRTLSITAGGSTAVTADIPTTLTGFNSISSSVFKGELEGNADSATKLYTARTIDGVSFDGSAAITHYGTCSTAAGTAAKTVALTGFELVTGAKVSVKFTVTNTVANPTLNVNGTGAKAIYYKNAAISAGYLKANYIYEFIYDGKNYVIIGDVDTNTDTKVTHSRSATSSFRPIILHSLYDVYGTDVGTATDQLYYNEVFAAQPSTGTIRATKFQGALVGNADTATTLATARTINGTSFNGSANITTSTWGTARTLSISGTAGTTGTSVDGSANASLVIPATISGFTKITSAAFAGPLTGNVTGNVTGNADTATKLKTARTISLTGDATGSGEFDGSGNLSITVTVADNSHNHSYLPLSGGTLTGVVNSSSTLNLYGSNAYFSLATGASATRCYFQTYNPVNAGTDDANLKAGFGFGWANSLTIDKSGNVNIAGTATATKVYGAVWNDYAEYRAQKETIEPGYCVASSDNGEVYKTTEKFAACDGIVSDTFGFSIGETDAAKTPLAVAGRVLAYCAGNREDYRAGDIVCAGPEGRVMKMTRKEIREYPDRIIGHVSEIPSYNTWGTGNIAVNGRIWIKVR